MKNHFSQYKRNVTSQWGEDGIIEEIFMRIGETNKYCVEFGAGNGTELSNVWNLISNKGWRAALIEPDEPSFASWENIAKPFGNKITLIKKFVTLEKGQTLDDILMSHNAPHDLDLLSVDIDSNDYHIFKSINKLKPRLILVEHNPTIPPSVDIFQEYNEEQPFGSSFAANVRLAHEKGYKLVTATVTNGFYVREDLFSKLNIEEPRPEDVFDNEAVTHIFSAYNGTLYMHGKQEAPSYTRLFRSSDVALTKKSIHSLSMGAGYNHRIFSKTLSKNAKPIKVFFNGPQSVGSILGFLPRLVKNAISPYFNKKKDQ